MDQLESGKKHLEEQEENQEVYCLKDKRRMYFKIEAVNNCVRCSEIKSNEDGELILGINSMVVISGFGKNLWSGKGNWSVFKRNRRREITDTKYRQPFQGVWL